MMEIIGLIFVVLFTALTGYIAKNNGRNVVLACILGFLFGIFATIGYAIIGKPNSTTGITENLKSSLDTVESGVKKTIKSHSEENVTEKSDTIKDVNESPESVTMPADEKLND